MDYLRNSVLAILIKVKQSNEWLYPKQISERLGIPSIQTDAAASRYFIVNSILCPFEAEGHV